MAIGFWQLVFVLVLVLLFFGRGKIPQLMGDIAEGIKSFKRGINDTNTEQQESATEQKISNQ
jgi:sec-independent protein translocase protein TatA